MKYAVTPELATLLKTLRAQSGVSAKDLAKHEGKSPSYISKLENASLKTVQKETLTSILTYISGGGDFFEEVLPNAYRTLQAFMEPYRLAAQVWLFDYDAVDRQVNVPEDMSLELKRCLDELGITAGELADRINANIDSGLGRNFPANQFAAIDYEGKPRLTYRGQVSFEEVEQLVGGKMQQVGYMFLSNVVFNLIRWELFPQQESKLPPEDAVAVLNNAAAFMDRWEIHSLIGYIHLMGSPNFVAYQTQLISQENDIPARIADTLSQMVKIESIAAIKQLNEFNNTLEWDPAFALKLMGIPFSELNGLSHKNKAKLLDDIQRLVDSYDSLPEMQRKFDEY